jgi:hypothetical protein
MPDTRFEAGTLAFIYVLRMPNVTAAPPAHVQPCPIMADTVRSDIPTVGPGLHISVASTARSRRNARKPGVGRPGTSPPCEKDRPTPALSAKEPK